MYPAYWCRRIAIDNGFNMESDKVAGRAKKKTKSEVTSWVIETVREMAGMVMCVVSSGSSRRSRRKGERYMRGKFSLCAFLYAKLIHL